MLDMKNNLLKKEIFIKFILLNSVDNNTNINELYSFGCTDQSIGEMILKEIKQGTISNDENLSLTELGKNDLLGLKRNVEQFIGFKIKKVIPQLSFFALSENNEIFIPSIQDLPF